VTLVGCAEKSFTEDLYLGYDFDLGYGLFIAHCFNYSKITGSILQDLTAFAGFKTSQLVEALHTANSTSLNFSIQL
jgi:hypothetical protein